MPVTLTVQDETTGGEKSPEFTLEFLTERVTVRELIRSRVYQEVQDYNASKLPERYRGLVRPTAEEETLNGPGASRRKHIDWHRQYEIAIAAFEASNVLILVDDRQAEGLDEEIEIKADTRVTFLKLVPLAGG